MAGPNPALYAAGTTFLGFVCMAIAATAVGLPVWGYYESVSGGWNAESGYFGPWKVCRNLNYGREICGREDFQFKVSAAVYVSGILAAVSSGCLGMFAILSIIQIAMVSSRDTVVMSYKPLVILKLILSTIAAVLAIIAAILFAVQIDNSNRNYAVSRGISFYLQIVVIVLTLSLLVMAIFDVYLSRRPGGDPTAPIDLTAPATTYNNPGFREGRRRNGASASVSVTDSSGKPYSADVINGGSIVSMNTTLTSVSNGSSLGSTVARSPLRSSLKKPKPKDGLGIQNPGFSGSSQSPPMPRNGSVKKVRIQTHSTEV